MSINTDRGTQEELWISERTFYMWRKEFIELIAERLRLEKYLTKLVNSFGKYSGI